MTNEKKYKTTYERITAFKEFFNKWKCDGRQINDGLTMVECGFFWLKQEAEEGVRNDK